MPSIFFAYQDSSPPKTWTDNIDKSPYPSIFRIKKATRFQQEPLSYADFLCIRYVYSGEALITTRDSRFVMRQNDILLINSGFVLSQYLMHEDDVVFTIMFEKDYLLDRRMEAVCSALKNTSLPISEIESEAGFQNETYFYKQFRRKYGMTPNEYRGIPG